MARQKTNKTAKKRFKLTNPKNKKKAKIMYSKSCRNHLKTKRSSKFKRRQGVKSEISPHNKTAIIRKVVNL